MADILIIDDSLTVRMDLKQAVEAAGFRVTLCETLEAARKQLASLSFDLIILDVLLPDGDGLELLKELKSRTETKAIPVLMLSTKAEIENRPGAMLAGADEYIGKPYDRNYLVARINSFLTERTEAPAGSEAIQPPGLSGRILAVDDSPTYLYRLAEDLRQEGTEVLLARSGEEALHLLLEQRVDAILLDLLMPGLSGRETCSRIKSSADWRGIPVLMLTAMEDREAMIASFSAGADDFIPKSSDFAVLKARLRVQLRRKQYESENARIREQLYQKEVEAAQARASLQAEQLARTLAEEWQTTFDAISDGVCVLDTGGRISRVNKQLTAILNRRAQELTGRTLEEILPVEPGREVDTILSSVRASLRRKSMELPLNERWFMLNVDPVAAGSGEAQLVCIFVEVTEQRQAEKEKMKLLIQAQRAQRLESIGILAGGLAHDFNNLLAGLFGYIELGRMYGRQGFHEKLTATLDKASSVMDQAKALTLQLLTFSKGGAPLMKVEYIATPLKEAAAFALSGSNVYTRFELPDDLWPSRIDPNQIRQAIDNILINAKEAMPEGGCISISAVNLSEGALLPKALPPGDYLRVSISDEGCGVDPDTVEHIFDPFFTTKETGHGLGLSIAYSIIKKHHGTIEVESELNKGTTFHIYLPASSEPVAPSEPPEEPVFRSRPTGHILVMDDECIIHEVVGAILQGLGYSVVSAFNGEEAIRLYEKASHTSRPFSAAILDLTIREGIGGKETIKRLLDIDPDVVAIASSGYSNDPVMADPKAYGFKGALTKPYQSKDLDDLLYSLLKDKEEGWLRAV